ncbi:MAG: aminotransferase class IV [Pseudomonadota bacterium]
MDKRIDWNAGAAWIAGQIVPIAEAKISVLDWGLTHSDITYDVVPLWKGGFFRLPDYLGRFEASMAALRLSIPQGRAEIQAALHAMVAQSGLHDAYVAMVASRGAPLIPGTRDPRSCGNHFYAWCVPYVYVIPQDVAARGAHLWVAKDVHRIPETSVSARAKNYHWGDFTQGLFEAYDQGCDTAVLTDHAGNLAEGPGFNVFAVSGGRVVTPRDHCLQGITRRTVLEICGEIGVEAEVRDLPLAEFLEADEVFLSTSGGGATPVTRVDGRILGNDRAGPVTERISAVYRDWLLAPRFRQPLIAHA